jgi:hypothetical protein
VPAQVPGNLEDERALQKSTVMSNAGARLLTKSAGASSSSALVIDERQEMLQAHSIAPKVIAHLEEIGIGRLSDL